MCIRSSHFSFEIGFQLDSLLIPETWGISFQMIRMNTVSMRWSVSLFEVLFIQLYQCRNVSSCHYQQDESDYNLHLPVVEFFHHPRTNQSSRNRSCNRKGKEVIIKTANWARERKPLSDEKTTTKAVVPDAFFGEKPSHTSTGMIRFPPPTPRSPPTKPARAPITTPTMTSFAPLIFLSDFLGLYRSMNRPAKTRKPEKNKRSKFSEKYLEE